LPHVTRTSGGVRDYTEEDCRWVAYIKCMRGAGVSVETLAEYVALFDQGERPFPRARRCESPAAQLARRVEK
jgi:DNA-binding transcriptional MerR regulator